MSPGCVLSILGLPRGWCVCYTRARRGVDPVNFGHDDDYFRGDFLQRLTGFGNRVVSWRLGVGLTPLQLCYRTFQFPRLRDLQEHAGRFGHDNVPSRHFVAIYRATYHHRGAAPRRLSCRESSSANRAPDARPVFLCWDCQRRRQCLCQCLYQRRRQRRRQRHRQHRRRQRRCASACVCSV